MRITTLSDFADTTITRFRAVYTSYTDATYKNHISPERPHWMMYIKITGSTWYYFNNEKYYSSPNSIILVAPNVRYTYECIEPGRVGILFFDLDMDGDGIYVFDIANSEKVLSAFKKILRDQGDVLCNIKCLKELYHIFEILIENGNKKLSSSSEEKDKVAIAYEYISDSFVDNGISNSSLASMCGLSEAHFRKIFTLVYGMPPMTYLRKKRMEAAKQIISDGCYKTISDIASKVGYSDVYHFSKMFKRYTGYTPNQYKKTKTEMLTWDMAVMKGL